MAEQQKKKKEGGNLFMSLVLEMIYILISTIEMREREIMNLKSSVFAKCFSMSKILLRGVTKLIFVWIYCQNANNAGLRNYERDD